MKKISTIAFLFAASLAAQVQLGKNVQIGWGSGQGAGTVGGGTTGQIAQYPSNGTTVQGAGQTLNAVAPLLGGSYYTDQFINGAGNNGLANLLAGPCASGGCLYTYPGTSTSTEQLFPTVSNTQGQDFRKGSRADLFYNPVANGAGGFNPNGQPFSGAELLRANWDAATQAPDHSQLQVGRSSQLNFNSPGWSWGGPIPGLTGPLWSVQKGQDITMTSSTLGITNMYGGTLTKHSAGDSAGAYIYAQSDGGCRSPSDECSTGIGLHRVQSSTWFHGTANAGSTTGSQLLQATYVPGTYSRPDFSVGGIMVDESRLAINGGHVTGPTTQVPGMTAWQFPIDTPVTPSTAYGIAGGNIPQLTNPLVAQSDTVTFTNILGTNAGGYTTGLACLAGFNHPEQVTITAVGTISGGSQSVTFTHRYPNGQSGTSLWQGGPCGTFYTPGPFYFLLNTWHTAYRIFGATDSSHLVSGFYQPAGIQPPPSFYNVNTANVPLAALSISGTTVTASFVGGQDTSVFDGLPSVVISGASTSSFNGTGTNAKVINRGFFGGMQIQWTQTGPVGTSATASISMPSSYFLFFTNYGAEVTQPCTSAGCPLEPNNTPWTAGDNLENVLDPAFGGIANSIFNVVNSPDSNSMQNLGGISISSTGAGISGSTYSSIALANGNANTMYRGAGGFLIPPTWMLVNGPGGTLINMAQPPLNGKSVFIIGCNPSSQGGCTSTDYMQLFDLPNGGNLSYQPSANEFDSTPFRMQRLRSPVVSTGDGSFINGGFTGGSPVAMTAASGVNGNLSSGLGAYATFGNETVLDASAKVGAAGFYAETIYGGATAPGSINAAAFGTLGTTTYTYACTSVTASGESLPSATATVSNGNAVLSPTNVIGIQCLPGYGAQSINVYRMSTVGSYSAGLICANVPNKFGRSSSQQACNDTGQAAGALAPTSDTSGKVQSPSGVFGAATVGGSPVCTTATGCGASLPSGTTNQMLYYAGAGTTVTPLTLGTNLSITSGVLNASSTAATNFNALTSGTNTTAAMLVGTGASLGVSGSGTIAATTLASTPTLCSTGNAPTGILANGNATGCAAIGGGGISGLTTGYIPKAASATSIANSLLDDGVTTPNTLTYAGAGGITAASFKGTGTTPSMFSLPAGTGSIAALPANSAGFAAPVTGGTAYLLKLPATITAGIPHYAAPATGDGVNESAMTVSGIAIADLTATGTPSSSTYLRGDGTWATPSGGSGIANVTTTVGTTAIAANTCSSAVTVTMTGVATTSVFDFTPNADVSGVTGWGTTGGLTIVAWPTSNTLNYKVCNQTASSITPSASVTFNVGAR